MTEHAAVVIAEGGPTGPMLAGELALAGVDVAIVERRASQDLTGARGNTVARARWTRVTLFHEAEHAAYVLRKSRCTSSAVRSTGAPFREREVSG
jgi:2-polyprenyl-6-methoxyphenol hydroxylase-like FAD-dependent oxidoreductase